MMTINTRSAWALCLAAAMAAVSVGGCNTQHTDAPSSEEALGTTTLRLSMTSASGKVYRLVSAVFDAQGDSSRELDGPTDSSDPQESLSATFAPGLYQITLRDGWQLFEVPSTGDPVPVPAKLVSSNPISVQVASRQSSFVNFQFEVGGEIIPNGTLTVGIGVTENDDDSLAPATPLPDGSDEPVIIPDTTRIADEATRALLTSYDAATGTLRFSDSTPLLESLQPDDVLVSEPSDAAPSGYLRKIISATLEDREWVLETSQANLTDAVTQGVLEAHTDLNAGQVQRTDVYADGVSVEASKIQAFRVGVGENYNFQLHFNHVFLPKAGPNARGQVSVDGSVDFNLGYGVHVGISPCFALPPVCVDSFESSVGFDQKASLKIAGDAEGELGEDFKVATQYYEPQIFFIGPLPVVIVPSLNLYLSASGLVTAKFTFEANETAVAKVGARWTDDDGWRDITNFDFGAAVPTPTFTGALKPRASAGTTMSLKLYDVIGPEASLKAGVELDGQIPRNPVWMINGFLTGQIGFRVELPIIGTLANYQKTLFDEKREFSRSENAKPTITLTENAYHDPKIYYGGTTPTVDLRSQLDFTPGCDGVLGGGYFFNVNDVEDGCAVNVTVSSDKDGLLPQKFAFPSVGRRIVTVIVTDSGGLKVQKTFALDVVNSPPVITLPAGGSPHQGEPYPIAATITDRNEADGARLCAYATWSVDAPDQLSQSGGCLQTVTFGTTGPRQVRVATHDSDGLVSSQLLTLDVQPPFEDPHPKLIEYGVYSSESSDPRIEFCPRGSSCCAAHQVPNDRTIDLTEAACHIGAAPDPAPRRYFASVTVDNPTAEALGYAWELIATDRRTGSKTSVMTGNQPSFPLDAGGNSLFDTDGCEVTLKITAADPTHSMDRFSVWAGSCSFFHTILR
jgi:hypothetical protein